MPSEKALKTSGKPYRHIARRFELRTPKKKKKKCLHFSAHITFPVTTFHHRFPFPKHTPQDPIALGPLKAARLTIPLKLPSLAHLKESTAKLLETFASDDTRDCSWMREKTKIEKWVCDARNRRTFRKKFSKGDRELQRQRDNTHRETARDRVLENRQAEFARWYGGDSRAPIGRRSPPTGTSLWSGPIGALVAFPRSETACAPTQGGSWLEARGSHSVSQSLSRPAVRYEVGSVNERNASFYLHPLLRG